MEENNELIREGKVVPARVPEPTPPPEKNGNTDGMYKELDPGTGR